MPVGPADVTVLLPIVKTAELEEVRLGEMVFSSEVVAEEVMELLEDPVPVGPADMTVLLPIVKTAELEELRLEEVTWLSEAVEVVMLLFFIVEATDEALEEVKAVEVDILEDAVRPAEEVAFPVGNGAMLLVSTGPVVDDVLALDVEAVVPLPEGSIEDELERVLDEETVGSTLAVLVAELIAPEELEGAEEPELETVEEDVDIGALMVEEELELETAEAEVVASLDD